MQPFLIVSLSLAVVASLLSFVFYGFDKRRAQRDGPRIPEKRLHLLTLLGGWPGALLGQRLFRHKTVKTRFRLVFWLTVVCHISVVSGIGWSLCH